MTQLLGKLHEATSGFQEIKKAAEKKEDATD